MLYSFKLVGMREIHRWPADDPQKGLIMHTVDVFFVGNLEKLLSKLYICHLFETAQRTHNITAFIVK